MERRKVAESEKQYLRGIIHNLSLQKWTDQDIVNYLRDEKTIDIGRSTVTKIKNQSPME
jgi:DNA-directed RNA polymerase specialized sigma54-like protein